MGRPDPFVGDTELWDVGGGGRADRLDALGLGAWSNPVDARCMVPISGVGRADDTFEDGERAFETEVAEMSGDAVRDSTPGDKFGRSCSFRSETLGDTVVFCS